jgi:hypothetical protein
MKFSSQAKNFVFSVIKQRRLLLNSNLNRKNSMEMHSTIEYLNQHIQLNGYNSDKAFAGFFIRNQHRIYSLIVENKFSQGRKEMFHALLKRAREIWNHSNQMAKSW